MLKGIFQTKSIASILSSAEGSGGHLKRTLGAWQLTLLGIGAIIGAGIFSTVGSAVAGAADRPGAGPAIVLSFVLTAVCCGFSALCYAEFASRVPVSGSAYTYAYATLGELVGWIIGWDLIIEYAIGNVAIAISWASYFNDFLIGFGIHLPSWMLTDYRTAAQAAAQLADANAAGIDPATLSALVRQNASALDTAPHLIGIPFVFNVPAFAIVALITVVLVRGVRESAWFNSTMVVIKLAIVALFIGLGFKYFKSSNMTPFVPNGFGGISAAASILFFAYIGFDAVSTASEEAKNPKRDMPIAILGSLIVCTVIYILVAIALTGMAPWRELGTADPLSTALGIAQRGESGAKWEGFLLNVGAVIATTSVLLVFQLGQPRIFFSMARDGLLPRWAAKVHPRFGTPHVTTILTGVFVAVLSGLCNINEIVDLCNIGTLFAFVLVCLGVMLLRFRDTDVEPGFRVPGGPFLVPILGTVSCVFLMNSLPATAWWRFVAWLALGMSVYLSYGYIHSVAGRATGRPTRVDLPLKLAAFGFLALAVGIFVLPHELSPSDLLDSVKDSSAAAHVRAMWGIAVSLAGVVFAIGGLAVSRER
ncbi:MAG: amino acid permease [Planctomycetes bacterium]|nr:amino acid permease [Planctomycetota bacterium]